MMQGGHTVSHATFASTQHALKSQNISRIIFIPQNPMVVDDSAIVVSDLSNVIDNEIPEMGKANAATITNTCLFTRQ